MSSKKRSKSSDKERHNHEEIELVRRKPNRVDGVTPDQHFSEEESGDYIVHHRSKTWYQKMAWLAAFQQKTAYQAPMLVGTVFALFSEDIQLAVLPMSADIGWDVLTITALLLFTIDLIVCSMAEKRYFLRVYFWLDLLAVLSLIPAIGVFGLGQLANNLSVARAGRAARAGTRTGRLVRIFKLFKLSRKKLYDNHDDGSVTVREPSVVGSRLTDRMTMKVVIGVMAMISIYPFLQLEDINQIYDYSVKQLYATYEAPGAGLARTAWESDSLTFFKETYGGNIIRLYVAGESFIDDTVKEDDRRIQERLTYKLNAPLGRTELVLDNRSNVRKAAGWSIAATIFVIVLLGLGNFLLQRDATQLVIKPIERMMGFVTSLASDPFSFTGINSKKKKRKKRKRANETDILQESLVKIGSLLQVSFGEAGANIISKNLAAGSAINAMVPGEKMEGIFGFCDIRQFTDTTECLQENVMPFVNTIAGIVHDSCKDNSGAPNKNIGDAFLLVWRLPDSLSSKARGGAGHISDLEQELESAIDDDQGRDNLFLELRNADPEKMKRITIAHYADSALRSFIRVITEIDTNEDLKSICANPSLLKRMPGYKVKMGFGLHIGWAIEGAIGSKHKVDASYLSPHVNLAARLESATKQYGKLILCSEAFVKALSPDVAKELRRIDCVIVKGASEPMVLYTYDYHVPKENNGHFTTYDAYRRTFDDAYQRYISGRWSSAAAVFEKCLKMWGDDEPCKTLLLFMGRHGLRPPANWKGHRSLDEK